MSREYDRRKFSSNRLTPEREALLREHAAREGRALPGPSEAQVTRFDAVTGNPAELLGAAPAATPPTTQAEYVERAMTYLGGFHDALGFAPSQSTEFQPDPNVLKTSSGAAAVHVQQLYRGIPIFQAQQAVQFNPQGGIDGTVGQSVSIEQQIDPTPAVEPDAATLIAARFLADTPPDSAIEYDQFGQPLAQPTLDLAGYIPTIISRASDHPEQTTRLSAGPFAEPPCTSLVWFYDEPRLDLAWQVLLTLPDYSDQYRLLVDAVHGDVLYCHQLVHRIAGQGNVYINDGGSPRRFVDFPLPLATYGVPIPADLPSDFPGDWIDDDTAEGNNVSAHLEDNGPTIGGARINGAIVFNPRLPAGVSQQILNLFYYVNRMHNFFYLLGFRERDGNFQARHAAHGGLPGDAVDARVYRGFVNGTATMTTPIDGGSPVMRTGAVGSTGRHTALDATVIYHEYTHGVTNRLVGGPANVHALDAVQSQAFGEGTSDFIACIAANTTVVGAWVVGRPGGIRSAPYTSAFPAHFGNLGQPPYNDVHGAGEIWCASLLELSRSIDTGLCLQLVMDSLRLMPANPTLLQCRDALFRALDYTHSAGRLASTHYSRTLDAAWRVFAHFGMGPRAYAPHAYTLHGTIPDFDAPSAAPLPTTTLESSPDGAALPTPAGDDFSRLPELDERSERKLHGAGVTSFAELATRTPAQLARIIAKAGFTAEKIRKLGWVDLAHDYAAALQTPGAMDSRLSGTPDAANHAERQRTTSFTLRLNITADGRVRKLAITHVRNGAQQEWETWNEQELLTFIRDQADLTPDDPQAHAAVHTGATQRLPQAIESVAGPPEPPAQPAARLTGETLARSVGDDQLQVELEFQVPAAVGSAPYIWQILARHRESDQVEVLGICEGVIEATQPEQRISTVVDLPRADGRYRLSSIMHLPNQAILLEVPGPPLSVETD